MSWKEHMQGHYKKIPPIFHSVDKEGPFERCIVCDKYLLEDGTQYLIEKAVRQYSQLDAESVMFELAVCMDCANKMRQDLSAESLMRIEQYFEEKANMNERYIELCRNRARAEGETPNEDEWLGNCIVTGDGINEVEEYQIYAHCDGPDMLFTHFPYMLSGAALDEIQELLSAKTKDELDDFTDKFLGVPPEFADLFKDRPVLVV